MNTHIKTFEQLTTKELFHIYKLRVDTFVVEQQCPYHEIDDIDLESHHIYFQQGKDILAYCRLYKQNDTCHIGRVIAATKTQRIRNNNNENSNKICEQHPSRRNHKHRSTNLRQEILRKIGIHNNFRTIR